jgi:hypothetical protein
MATLKTMMETTFQTYTKCQENLTKNLTEICKLNNDIDVNFQKIVKEIEETPFS